MLKVTERDVVINYCVDIISDDTSNIKCVNTSVP